MQLIPIVLLWLTVCFSPWAVSAWGNESLSKTQADLDEAFVTVAQLLSGWLNAGRLNRHADLTFDLSHGRTTTQPWPDLSPRCSDDIRPSTFAPPSFNITSGCEPTPYCLTYIIQKVIYDHSHSFDQLSSFVELFAITVSCVLVFFIFKSV